MVRFEVHLDHSEIKEEEGEEEEKGNRKLEEEEEEDDDEEEDEELVEEEDEEEDDGYYEEDFPSSSPEMDAGDDVSTASSSDNDGDDGRKSRRRPQFSLTAVVAAALRRSLVMCSAGAGAGDDEVCRPSSAAGMEISWPTDVRHVAHVTFDRFSGFLGLPVELEPELPGRVPSASVSVFGVSAESMQCSFDKRGNSVPTILLSMQRHLYLQGGLQVEGIFRITAENSQELLVRDQLNCGVVPQDVDSHCLAGLIKAWFRELPTGVLDSLTPEQVMHCNSEEECTELIRLLPQTEAALLDWAINLMADVVDQEHYNKMNARNIAMVFAPNMTQMADPLTALIHAVQVMNLLKTLIMKTLQEREEAVAASRLLDTCSESPRDKDESELYKPTLAFSSSPDGNSPDFFALDKFLFDDESTLGSDTEEGNSNSFDKKIDAVENQELISQSPPSVCEFLPPEARLKDEIVHENHLESALSRTTFRKGMWKLCRHSVFQLSRSSKKLADISMLSSREGDRGAWT